MPIRPPPPPPDDDIWSIDKDLMGRDELNRRFIKAILKTGLFKDQAPLLEATKRTILGITPSSGVYSLKGTDFILVVSIKKYWLKKGSENIRIGFDDVISSVDETTQTNLLFHLEILRNVKEY